jgi:argininosuccinate synthase
LDTSVILKWLSLDGIEVTATKGKPFSEDENLLHISHEAGILEDPSYEAGEEVYSRYTRTAGHGRKPLRGNLTWTSKGG